MSGAVPIDVVVLAAGRGSRLAQAGIDCPKWLLEVHGRTIADAQLAGLRLLRGSRPGRLRDVLAVTGYRADLVRAALPAEVREVENPHYATLNNWYSLLIGLRALRDDGARVIVFNADLYADPSWYLAFLEAAADTDDEALLAIDFQRKLTAESMKVSARPDGALLHIGKHEFDAPVGEYVGMLMASGSAMAQLRSELEAFEDDPDAVNEWYEGAIARMGSAGVGWRLWPTPSSAWVEIDDVTDLEAAGAVSDA